MAVPRRYCGIGPLLLFTLLLLDLVAASPTDTSTTQSSPLETRAHTADDAINCTTERSPDFYGLGVRIGLYFVWLQAYIANVCVPSEIAGALDTNCIYFAAVLLSLVRCTISTQSLQSDALILMHMGGGFIFSVSSIWGYRTCTYDVKGPKRGIRDFGGFGTHFRLLIVLAISIYGFWYWTWGVKGGMQPFRKPGCEVVYTFMFAKVRADGGVRIFYIICCVGTMLYFGAQGLISFVAAPTRLRRIWLAHIKGSGNIKWTRRKFATGLTQKQLRRIFYFCRIGNLLWIIYSMILIEFTLNYNNMVEVIGSGGHIGFPAQLIPTIIGAFGFCKVVWVRYKQWKSERPEEYNPPVQESGKTFQRSILHPLMSEFHKIYTPKSNESMQNNLDDNYMDPVMEGRPLYVRLVVSWAPWLGVLFWNINRANTNDLEDDNHDDDDDNNGQSQEKNVNVPAQRVQFESPALMSSWSNETTPRMATFNHSDTWRSDDTLHTIPRKQPPQIPKTVLTF